MWVHLGELYKTQRKLGALAFARKLVNNTIHMYKRSFCEGDKKNSHPINCLYDK
jgi:hypothetical protein